MSNWEKIWGVLQSGGFVMIALLAIALLLYSNLIRLLLFVVGLKVRSLYNAHLGEEASTRESVIEFKEKLGNIVKTQSKYAGVLIAAAPLLGLLGTVIGMLDTFRGIGAEAAEDTTKAVADGVKVALITTQAGLSIAIVGIILQSATTWLYRKKSTELIDIELEAMKKGSPA